MKRMLYIIIAIFIAGNAFAQTVEFRVDMSDEALRGEFNVGTDTVHIAGTFNGWNTTATQLDGPDADTIYTVTIDTFAVGDTLMFKFVKNSDGWESIADRMYVVPEGNSVYEAFFDSVVVTAETKELAVTFSVNMEFEIVSGRFIPATDTLTVRGTFNGWSGDDILSQSSSDPNYYELTVNYVAFVGEEIGYKYAYLNATGTAWEGDPNKIYVITQEDFDAGSVYTERTFNDLTLDNITNNPVTIKFVVNVNGAVSSYTGQPFTSIENVVIAGANPPLQWPVGGWPDDDSTVVHYMYNDGTNGDMVADDSLWTLELVFPQYSPFRIQYKYGANWGLPSNTGSNDNEAGVASDHFIELTSDMVSATVRNQWGVTGDHELVDVVTGVTEIPSGIPAVYNLDQNYPNPFNPTTNIRFSVPEAGVVTLKIFNLLGQEVATLLNEQMNAGTFDVDFNAANLTSGVYFYTISAGNYTATKKMLLMK
ncbi:MAG: T9SS type A sorting domain-containing protein [Ignavibacteriaceae bacterium]